MQWWCSAQGVAWDWSWQAYPGVWIFILLVAAGYRKILRATPVAAGEPGRGKRIAAFASGLFFLWLALDWPIGALGAGYLASAHMVQFLLLAFIAPPLILYGIPPAAFEPLRQHPLAMGSLRALTQPLIALLVFNGLIIVTHLPSVTDAMMASQLGSLIIDLTWIIAAFIFWWPIMAPLPERRWFQPLSNVGYIGAQLILGKPVFVYLTFAEYPVYATYELAPRVHGFAAAADQQLAGLLMETAGALILFAATSIVFLSWGAREQRTSVRTDTRVPDVAELSGPRTE
jgi:putative membrane protein